MMPRGIVNLSQNADFTGGGSKPWVPALLRSSHLYHQTYKRGLIGQEALQIQGLPALADELGLPVKLPWSPALHGHVVHTRKKNMVFGVASFEPARDVLARWEFHPLAARRRIHHVGSGDGDWAGAV